MPDEKPDIVSYSTFVRDLTETEISDVTIYGFSRGYGQDAVDLTYRTEDGNFRATKGEYQLQNDSLLTHTLETQGVAFVTLAQGYGTDDSEFNWWDLSSVFIFLVPLIMLLTILRQSKTIRVLSESLAKVTTQNFGEQSPHDTPPATTDPEAD